MLEGHQFIANPRYHHNDINLENDVVEDEVVEFADSGVTGGEVSTAGSFYPGAGSYSQRYTITQAVQGGTTVTLKCV